MYKEKTGFDYELRDAAIGSGQRAALRSKRRVQVFDGEYFEFGAVVALIVVGALCLAWGEPPAESYTELSASPQSDTSHRQRPQRTPFIWVIQSRQGDSSF